MLKNITIKDIAQRVGVSKATVSYYLNGNFKKMSFQTRERIREVIEETGYQPNSLAKGLATKNTQTIGVVIADITNPFISSVMKGIHDSCKEFGYTVNFTNSDNDLQTEIENIQRLKRQSVSGIILDSVAADHHMVTELDNHQTVMVDRQSQQLLIDTVVSDNQEATENFLELMLEKGYEDIYFVTFPIRGISTRALRYQGFQNKLGYQDDSHLLILKKGTEQKIFQLIASAKKKLAFFTMNGPALLEFMKILNQSDYSYPEDFGLGSYEDLAWMEVLNPSVSCIRQDSYQIGRTAAQCLIGKLKKEKEPASPRILEVKSDIILRNSF